MFIHRMNIADRMKVCVKNFQRTIMAYIHPELLYFWMKDFEHTQPGCIQHKHICYNVYNSNDFKALTLLAYANAYITNSIQLYTE